MSGPWTRPHCYTSLFHSTFIWPEHAESRRGHCHWQCSVLQAAELRAQSARPVRRRHAEAPGTSRTAQISVRPCVGHDKASGSAFARAGDLEIQAQQAAAAGHKRVDAQRRFSLSATFPAPQAFLNRRLQGYLPIS